MPANDNPYGTVYLQQSVYRVQEPLEGVYTANITVIRGYVQLQMSPFSFHSKGFELNFLYFFVCLLPLLQRWSLWTFGDPVQHL